jgi:hypothetical protein
VQTLEESRLVLQLYILVSLVYNFEED